MSSELLYTVLVGGLMLVGAWWLLSRLLRHGSGAGGSGLGALLSRVPRTNTLFVGLCGSGKTTMFLRLVAVDEGDTNAARQSLPETNASMRPNRGVVAHTKDVIVDYPGHRRLRGDLYTALLEAKRLVVVVDSITIQDDRTEGAQAVADLLYDVLQCNAFDGVESVLFACTKRDDVTSFSAKAVRRLLETEVARQLSTRSAAVGSIDKVSGAKSSAALGTKKGGGAAAAAERSDECVLVAQAGSGKFSFDDVCVPCYFVDVSADSTDADYNLDAVALYVHSGVPA